MLALADRSPTAWRRDPEEIALQALAYIAWNAHELRDFLAVTGLEATTVRQAATTPAFLSGVLDYVVSEPAVLRTIAGRLRVPEDEIHQARRELLPRASVTPVAFGPGPLALRCEHCRKTRALSRRDMPHIPDRVVTIEVARCGPCGGGFDGPETWLDREWREVAP